MTNVTPDVTFATLTAIFGLIVMKFFLHVDDPMILVGIGVLIISLIIHFFSYKIGFYCYLGSTVFIGTLAYQAYQSSGINGKDFMVLAIATAVLLYSTYKLGSVMDEY